MEKSTPIILPKDFFSFSGNEITIFFYDAEKPSTNNRITFSQNLLCLLLDGEKVVLKDKDKIAIKNDKFFLLTAGNGLMSEKIIKNKIYKSILIFFSDEFILRFIKKASINLSAGINENSAIVTFEKDLFVLNYEKSLLYLKESLLDNYDLVETKLNEILFYLLEKSTKDICNFFIHVLSKNRNSSIKEIIEKHETSNLNIDELAFLCNMSSSTFKRKFSEVYNATPKQYFIKLKMERALSMLRQMKKPSDIYFVLGYENLSSFSNEFKKHFGVSPSHYKAKI